jgi:hypothetical protein
MMNDLDKYFAPVTNKDVDQQIDETFAALDRGEIKFLSKEEADARIEKKKAEILDRLKK